MIYETKTLYHVFLEHLLFCISDCCLINCAFIELVKLIVFQLFGCMYVWSCSLVLSSK